MRDEDINLKWGSQRAALEKVCRGGFVFSKALHDGEGCATFEGITRCIDIWEKSD